MPHCSLLNYSEILSPSPSDLSQLSIFQSDLDPSFDYTRESANNLRGKRSMEIIMHCAVLVRNPEDVWEGSRASLGLAVGDYYGHLFVIDVIVNMTEELKENRELLF